MAKRLSILTSLILVAAILSVFGFGCKKAEQAKETTTPTAVQTKPLSGVTVLEYNFETGAGKWWPTGKIKIEQTSDKKHSGNASLRISGTSPAGKWNYVESTRFGLESGKKYKLTAWMLVKSQGVDKFPPFLKTGVEQNRNWLANFSTKKYDLSRTGEWQDLSVEFTTPTDAPLQGYLSVEKGTKDAAINADIYVDDLKLEVIQ